MNTTGKGNTKGGSTPRAHLKGHNGTQQSKAPVELDLTDAMEEVVAESTVLPVRWGRHAIAPETVHQGEVRDLPRDHLATLYPNEVMENAPDPDLLMANALAGIDWGKYNFTERQRRFIEFYCLDPSNGTRAALRAGYSERTAHVEASYALRNPHITAAIATVMNARIERTALTKDKILHTLEVLMTAEPSDFIMVDGQVAVKEGKPTYLTRAIKSVEYVVVKYLDQTTGDMVEERKMKVTLYDKAAILRMAGQYHKMFTDVQEINAKLDVVHRWKVGDREITF